MSLRAIGAPTNILDLHATCQRQNQYFITTRNGVADQYNKHSPPDHPCHGAGQGPCDAPARWTAVSSCLLRAFNKIATSLTLENPTKSISATHRATAFVDDSRLCHHVQRDATNTQLIDSITHNASWWERLLHTTGGRLKNNKSTFIHLSWTTDSIGIPRLVSKKERPLQVNIRDSSTGTY